MNKPVVASLLSLSIAAAMSTAFAAPPKAPSTELSADAALTLLSGEIKGSSWRKVYLPQNGSTRWRKLS